MINLLPPQLKQNIRFAKLNVVAVNYMLLAIVVIVCLVGVLLFGVTIVKNSKQDLRTEISQKEQVLAELTPNVEKARQLDATINTIGALLEREVSFSKLLQDIGGVIPNGAILTGLALTGNASDPLQIDAEINDQTLAAVLQENLEKSALFENVDIQSIAAAKLDDNNQPLNFTIRLIVNFEKEATP